MEIIALKQAVLTLVLLFQSCFAAPDEVSLFYSHQFSADGKAWNENQQVGMNAGDSNFVGVSVTHYLGAPRKVQVVQAAPVLQDLPKPEPVIATPVPEPIEAIAAQDVDDVIKVAKAIDGMSTGTLVILTVLITILGVFALGLAWIFREKLKGLIPGRKK